MTLDEIIRLGDRKEWREYLKHCSMQQACLAHAKVSRVKGLDDMRELAFKRMRHLNGEDRSPELWP